MGELAALATSLFWSLTSIQFTLAGRRIGSQRVNRLRLLAAVLNLSLLHLLLQGRLLPLDAEPYRWGWLGLSGMIGLVIGDAFLFQSFLLIGPRRSMLVMTLAPVISSLAAWGWLGEKLAGPQIGAILITLMGVAWVVSERRGDSQNHTPQDRRTYLIGLAMALGAAAGQAIGLVIAKQGLAGGFSSLSATLMRMLVASFGIWFWALLRGQVRDTWQATADRPALLLVAGGALTGPTIGVWLSLMAVQNAPVGVASALMSLPPILLIPLSWWIFKDVITLRAIAGTVVALLGAAMLFLV